MKAGGSALLSVLLSLPRGATLGAPPPRSIPKPLPSPPTMPVIRIEAARDHLLVVQEILLRRGDWTGGDLDLFVAFGAPGSPRAVDARIFEADDTNDIVAPGTPSETVAVTRAFRRPANVRLLLGTSSMAGAVLHVRASSFRALTQRAGVARVRLRTLLDLPAADVRAGHEVLIRLGSDRGEPDALGSIEVAAEVGSPRIQRAEARLCGPSADPFPLTVHIRGYAPAAPNGYVEPTIAPVLSTRRASDDLCVRFWTVATKAP